MSTLSIFSAYTIYGGDGTWLETVDISYILEIDLM
jgi:hypothetical protein